MMKAMLLVSSILLMMAPAAFVNAQTAQPAATQQSPDVPAIAAQQQQMQENIKGLQGQTARNTRAITQYRNDLVAAQAANQKALRETAEGIGSKIDSSSAAARADLQNGMERLSDESRVRTETSAHRLKIGGGILFAVVIAGILFAIRYSRSTGKKIKEGLEERIEQEARTVNLHIQKAVAETRQTIEARQNRAKIAFLSPNVNQMIQKCQELRAAGLDDTVFFDQVAKTKSGEELGIICDVKAVFKPGPLFKQKPDIFFPGERIPQRYKDLPQDSEAWWRANREAGPAFLPLVTPRLLTELSSGTRG